MGQVYLGHDTLLDRPVAIKFVRAPLPDAQLREQFFTEARAAARLQHPNVLSVHRIGEIDGHLFIVSEYIRGQSLDRLPKPLPWQRALELGVALSRALAAAHRRGILHRDIKPANAIIDADGQVKLLDFGLAKFIDVAAVSAASTDSVEPVVLSVDAAARTLNAAHALAITQDLTPEGTPVVPAAPSVPVLVLVHARRWEGAPVQPHLRLVETPVSPPSGGGIKGTPHYMAPEIWRGEAAGQRSDVYSMGALLYELCTGDPPHAEVGVAQLAEVSNREPAPSLTTRIPGIEPRFAALIDRCLRIDPKERYANGDALREAMESLAAHDAIGPIPEGNPYRGLLPFEAEHRALFFGRANEIGTVIDRMRSEPFVLITADSGMGKSSLCRAGVLPHVARGALGGGRQWSILQLTPGRHPLAALVGVVAPLLGLQGPQLVGGLQDDASALRRALERHLGVTQGVVLFIDQLEELVTTSPSGEAQAFGRVLGPLLEGLGAVRLLATIRSDFLARASSLAGLGEGFQRALYLLPELSRDKLREAIVGPAQAKGVRFESAELVEALIDSAQQAECGLPLLQFTLAELWDAHHDQSITSAELRAIGGVSGALARHADHVLLGLLKHERDLARDILLALVNPDGTRARRREDELLQDARARPALEALLRGRLVVAREAGDGPAYELAHEVLLKGWGALRMWLEQSAESRTIKQVLEVATASWLRLGSAREALWGERQLAQLGRLKNLSLTAQEAEFIAASRQHVLRQRRRRRLLLVSIPLSLALILAAVQARAYFVLSRQVTAAMETGQAIVQRARQHQGEARSLRAGALVRFREQQISAGESLWEEARRAEGSAEQEYVRASQLLEPALTAAPGSRELRALLAEVIYQRLLQTEGEPASRLRVDLLQRLKLHDTEGRWLRRLQTPASLSVHSAPAGAAVYVAEYRNEQGHRQLLDKRELGKTPLQSVPLPRGDYVLFLRAASSTEVRYPIRVGSGEALSLLIELPDAASLPAGFVYVPPGRFLFGSQWDEVLRRDFLATLPLHPSETAGYLIARHETTYADWLFYLRQLPWPEVLRRSREGGEGLGGVQLPPGGPGKGAWTLEGDHLILNSPPKPSPDFLLQKSAPGDSTGIVIQITDPNRDILGYVMCQIETEDGEILRAESNSEGTIYFESNKPLHKIYLLHRLWPNEPFAAEVSQQGGFQSDSGVSINPIGPGDSIATKAIIQDLVRIKDPPVRRRIFMGPYKINGQRDKDGDGIPDAAAQQQVLAGELVDPRELANMCWYVEGVVEKSDREVPTSMDRPALVPGGLVPGATQPGSSAPYGSYPNDKLVIPAGLSGECLKNTFPAP